MTDQAEQAPNTETALQPAIEAEARRLARRLDELTVNDPLLADMIKSVDMAGPNLQRWVVRRPLYPRHLYATPGASVPPSDLPDHLFGATYRDNPQKKAWGKVWSVGVRAEGYDWLNEIAGIQFHTPPEVHGRDGTVQANPIRTGDLVIHREVGIGYSQVGQMRVEVEDIELDFRQIWQAERLKRLEGLIKPKGKSRSSNRRQNQDEAPPWDDEDAAPAQAQAEAAELEDLLVRDENGAPKLGHDGELLFKLPMALEVEAADVLLDLRRFGTRKAKTIARRRLLSTLLAIRTIDSMVAIGRPELGTHYVWITGWRDNLTADERLDKARDHAREVFGAAILARKVEGDELDDAADEIEEADFREAPPDPQAAAPQPSPAVPAAPTGSTSGAQTITQQARAGALPGVSVGMPGKQAPVTPPAPASLPGERLAKSGQCGMSGVIGSAPCLKAPEHWKTEPLKVHASENGTWPATDA